MLRLGWIAAVVVVVSALSPVRADACSMRVRQAAQPPDGATNVPLNVVPRVIGIHDGIADMPLRLSGPGGDVAITVVRHDVNSLEVRPALLLAPRTTYQLTNVATDPNGPPLNAEPLTVSFTTGDAEDTTAPSAPTITGVQETHSDWFNKNTCPAWQRYQLGLTDLADANTPSSGLLVEVTPGKTTDALTPTHAYTMFPGESSISADPSASDLAVELRAVDWAGNVSPPTAPRQLKRLGCSSVPGGGAPAVALLVAWALRRRSAARARAQGRPQMPQLELGGVRQT